MNDEYKDLINGGYDLHIHTNPSHFNRLLDDFEALEQAKEFGMSGILIKSHYESTAARAKIATKYVGEGKIKAYGSIVLNHPVGGLNPFAVYSALEMGAKIIFMPTRDSLNCLKFGNMDGDFFERKGICILDKNGKLKNEVIKILDIIKEKDGILATGHIATEESMILCREGYKRDIKMILTHPEWPRTRMSAETQQEFVNMGVFVEKCWYNILDNKYPIEEMVATINKIGAQNCFLSTDRGQVQRETPVEGMIKFIELLMKNGINEKQIEDMFKTTPKKIIEF